MQISHPLSLLLVVSFACANAAPFLLPLASGTGWIIGNDLWNITIGQTYGTKLFYKGKDLIGKSVGHYSSYDGKYDFNWTSARTYTKTPEYLDIVFTATEIDLHWVIFPNLAGAYQYIVNKQLPALGELRTLFRLDNTTFTHGRTNIKDALLPPISEYLKATKVQDETWEQADGTYLTKYDFSAFLREIDFHGIYGNDFGSWYIRPGRDYFNGNHLRQELTVHRESTTGDAVQLNNVHGSHFLVPSLATFPVNKIWGPWLWYLNNGSKADASIRAEQEFASWPYNWINDTGYQARGSVSGKLVLSDGLPAAGAAVFLGDNKSSVPTLEQGDEYYYAAYADAEGLFQIDNVRSGDYGFYAWSNGGKLANISNTFTLNGVSVKTGKTTDLGTVTWEVNSRTPIFQIGDFDHKTLGFHYGGAPYQHALVAKCPASLTYTIGTSNVSEWCFGQSFLGTWTVVFNVPEVLNKNAILSISLAGYSKSADMVIKVNGVQVGTLVTANLANDPGLYRSATTAGEWRYYEFDFTGAVLVKGSNKATFQVTRYTEWRGFMWDSVLLDWE